MGSGKKYTKPITRYFNVGLFDPEASHLCAAEQKVIDHAEAEESKPDLPALRRRIFCAGLRLWDERQE